MPVDTSTPVPDELDARVEQMLQQMDRVHAEVVNRLDPSADDGGPDRSAAQVSRLDAEVDRALQDAAAAAKVLNQSAEQPPLPAPAPLPPASTSPPPSSPSPPAIDESNGDGVPTATIKELDDQLASAVSKAIDDDFADGSQLVEGQSLDVPLPASSPLGQLPAVAAPEVPAPEVSAAPVVEAAAPAPAPAPVAVAAPAPPPPAPVAPAPVAKPAPAPAPAAKPAPAPVKAATPAVIVPAKPTGPTMADRFWTVATPVMEPIAVRLGKLPVGFQHTVGWIGIVTLFMAGATWGYVLFFQETRPASHIPLVESGGHGDPVGADAHGGKSESGHDASKPSVADESKHASPGTGKPAAKDSHSAESGHSAAHEPEKSKDTGHSGH